MRGVTFKEDKTQVRTGKIAEAMAALRDAAISLKRVSVATKIAAASRRYAAGPGLAVSAIGLDLGEGIDPGPHSCLIDIKSII